MGVEILVTHVSGKLARSPARYSKDCLKLGRLHDNDLYFDEYAKKLSRYHAAVFVADGIVYVKDMGSKNGTWVNGVKLAEQHRPLSPTDLVKLGDRGPVMRFELSNGAALPAPAPPPPRPASAPPPPAENGRKTIGKSTLLALEDVMAGERVRTKRMLVVAGLSSALVLLLVALVGLFLHARSVEALKDAQRREQEELRASYEARLQTQLSELARSIEDRDKKLAEIRNEQGISEAQRQAMLEATQKELASLREKMATQEKALEKQKADEKKAGPTGWPEVVERMKESLFLCYGGTSERGGIGTAFAVSPDVLATNAHVVKLLSSSSERYVIQNSTGTVFKIKDFKAHPDFNGTPQSPDVGLIRIDTGGATLVSLPLATDDDLRRLRIGAQLGTLGYPGELAQDYFKSYDQTAKRFKGVLATFKDGWIGRMTNYRAEADAFAAQTLIQHSASLTGGTSGSPMFTQDGKVVALNNASLDYEVVVQGKGTKKNDVKREKSGAELSWAIRVDELRRLKEQTGW